MVLWHVENKFTPLFHELTALLPQDIQSYRKWYQLKSHGLSVSLGTLVPSSVSKGRQRSGRLYPPVLLRVAHRSLMWITSLTYLCIFLGSVSITLFKSHIFNHCSVLKLVLNKPLTHLWLLNWRICSPLTVNIICKWLICMTNNWRRCV